MSETAVAAVERPLALPINVVADLLASNRPLLIARIEKHNVHPVTNERLGGSSPNPAKKLLDGIGWTEEQLNESFPFPHGEVGDRLWIQEEFQRNFSSHVSNCGVLYRATDIGRFENHGPWCYEKDGRFFDYYNREFFWQPAEEMTRPICRLVYEILGWEIAFQYPEEPGHVFKNPYCWHIQLKRVEA